MRSAPAPIISEHKFARLTAWAQLWLIWFAGAFATLWGRGEGASPRRFDRAARLVAQLVIVRAAMRMAPPARAAHRHGRKAPARVRAVAGSALRRAMRGRDGASRLFAILGVLRDVDAHAGRLLRRLRAGMTRLRVILPRAESAHCPGLAPRAAVFAADTS